MVSSCLRRHPYSRFLYQRGDPEVSPEQALAEAGDMPAGVLPASLPAAKAHAKAKLVLLLSSRFHQAGAIHQGMSAILDQTRWRRRMAAGGPVWSWSGAKTGGSGPWFDELLSAALFAFLKFSALWSQEIKLGGSELSDEAQVSLNQARVTLQQRGPVQRQSAAAATRFTSDKDAVTEEYWIEEEGTSAVTSEAPTPPLPLVPPRAILPQSVAPRSMSALDESSLDFLDHY